MIKASELRIGNYLYGKDKEPFKVDGNDLKVWDFWKDEVDGVPIPLTEEILLKIKYIKFKVLLEDDFKENTGGLEQSIVKEYLLPNEVSLEYFVNIGDFDVLYKGLFIDYYDKNEIYLHQLQNLYFVLTGKELEINL